MLPEPVTKNVTNERVGGLVFTSEIIPKNSVNEADERSLRRTTTASRKIGGIGVSNLTVEIVHKLTVQEGT